MKYRVVTTCNADGWKQTGRRMVESFISRWAAETLPITVYAEGFDIYRNEVEVRRLPAWLDEFKERHAKTPSANGFRNGVYDYRFDAVKFAHKVAALTDFALSIDEGAIIWLDADTFTHADVTIEWLDGLFPGDGYLAWLDRTNCYPECGVVFYRASHPYHRNFMEAFRQIYISGELFRMKETHDSFVLQTLVHRKVVGKKIAEPVSLSGDGKRTGHVLANSALSTCLDHMKGMRKTIGRTPKNERFLVSDNNPYWR